MTAAKTPQDRKPKVTRKDGTATVTIDGITVTVPDDVMDDFELLMDLGEMQEGNAAKMTSVFKRLLADQGAKVLDGLREESGRVKATRASQWIFDLFQALRPNS